MSEQHSSHAKDRRAPTAAEARALAHPLRLRILFSCRDRARTNKELAQALDTTPGTIHYHLKPLVQEGFLRPEEPRPGPRGSTEQPYRSTGKSWGLSGSPQKSRILREVGASELLQAEDDDIVTLARLGMTLTSDEVVELKERLHGLSEEFAARSRDSPYGEAASAADTAGEDQESVTLFFTVHRSPGLGEG